MHVMQNSDAAIARSEKVSLAGLGSSNRDERRAFTGCTTKTAEAIEIAATKDVEFTAGAGFTSAVN
jgi:nucleoid DNA-binding protein